MRIIVYFIYDIIVRFIVNLVCQVENTFLNKIKDIENILYQFGSYLTLNVQLKRFAVSGMVTEYFAEVALAKHRTL